MNRTRLLAVLAAGAIALVACGGDDSSSTDTVPAAPATEAPAAPAAGESVAARIGETDLGPVLVGANGNTLYGFTNDTPTQSNCDGTCAEAWPPVIVTADWTVAPGVDSAIFNTITRADGSLQLVAGKWPLYYFSGDSVPGDLNGQGSGDVWFAMGTDGALIKEAAIEQPPASDAPADPYGEAAPTPAPAPAPQAVPPATVQVTESPLGQILADSAGLTVYGFMQDADGNPTCNDACADAWPPVIIDGEELPAGLDGNVFSIVERADGSHQLKAGNWPLYRFAGDANPGETNGQGSGDVWFVVAPDGKLIK
jgi:predicted lipoprotein with Yx(FWY)xxD motif